jgi:hypothetical protein
VTGGTATVADPLKCTRPTLNRSGSPSTNARAACCTASKRLGSTSVACIDVDTSSATMIVARSLGTSTSVEGRAKPRTSSASVAQNAAAGTCLRQPGREGATLSSSSRLVKRTA